MVITNTIIEVFSYGLFLGTPFLMLNSVIGTLNNPFQKDISPIIMPHRYYVY